MDKIDESKALEVLVELAARSPKSNAEAVGGEYALTKLKAAIEELNGYRNPPPVKAAD